MSDVVEKHTKKTFFSGVTHVVSRNNTMNFGKVLMIWQWDIPKPLQTYWEHASKSASLWLWT